MSSTRYALADSPLGPLTFVGEGSALRALLLPRAGVAARTPSDAEGRPARRDDDAFAEARAQLAEYFAGTRTEFDLETDAPGSAFQQLVWAGLRRVPFGQTWSYGRLAAELGLDPRTASRAVGAANGRNPLAVVVPCHRVIGADGSLTGYAGGLDTKRLLLDHEARVAATTLF